MPERSDSRFTPRKRRDLALIRPWPQVVSATAPVSGRCRGQTTDMETTDMGRGGDVGRAQQRYHEAPNPKRLERRLGSRRATDRASQLQSTVAAGSLVALRREHARSLIRRGGPSTVTSGNPELLPAGQNDPHVMRGLVFTNHVHTLKGLLWVGEAAAPFGRDSSEGRHRRFRWRLSLSATARSQQHREHAYPAQTHKSPSYRGRQHRAGGDGDAVLLGTQHSRPVEYPR